MGGERRSTSLRVGYLLGLRPDAHLSEGRLARRFEGCGGIGDEEMRALSVVSGETHSQSPLTLLAIFSAAFLQLVSPHHTTTVMIATPTNVRIDPTLSAMSNGRERRVLRASERHPSDRPTSDQETEQDIEDIKQHPRFGKLENVGSTCCDRRNA